MSPEPLDTSFSAIIKRLLDNLGPGTDTNTGSMARTLAESYAREMATFYAMLDHAHRSGYLETAEGGALDNVVAVLGLSRARAGRLTGEVEFSRNSPAPDDIGIPAGRQVTGVAPAAGGRPKPLPLFETLEEAVLRRGDTRVVVRVQEIQDDSEASKKAPPVIDPGKLTMMPRPVLGIEAVTNRTPIRRTGEQETDASLRARARTTLRDGEKGTLEALAAAVRQQGVQKVTVREPPDALPGVVEVLVGDPDFGEDAQAVARVEQAILVTKAAGIHVRLDYARTVYFEVELQVEPENADMDEVTFDRVRRELQQALVRFARSLPVGETVSRRKLEAVLFGNPAVRQIGELRVTTYLRGVDPQTRAPVLVSEGTVREYGPYRDWRLAPRETPTIDLEKKPPRITRLRPPIHRLNLVVSRSRTDTRTTEEVRQSLRGAVELYAARLAQDAKARQLPSAPIRWEDLQGTLKSQAGVEGLLSATLLRDDGFALTLQSGDPQPSIELMQGVRLVLGEAELVLLG